MIILNLFRFTQIQVKCVLSKDMPITYKYVPYTLPFWQSVTKPQEYIECSRIHSTQDYRINKPSLKDLNLESCCKNKVWNLDLALTCLS